MTMTELLKVIPVGCIVPRESGGVLVVASVELWSDAVVLRTVEVTPLSAPPPVRADAAPAAPRVEWQLTDDLGTEYQLSGSPPGGVRGSSGRCCITHAFPTTPRHSESSRRTWRFRLGSTWCCRTDIPRSERKGRGVPGGRDAPSTSLYGARISTSTTTAVTFTTTRAATTSRRCSGHCPGRSPTTAR